jgi:hypothetical protein
MRQICGAGATTTLHWRDSDATLARHWCDTHATLVRRRRGMDKIDEIKEQPDARAARTRRAKQAKSYIASGGDELEATGPIGGGMGSIDIRRIREA